jgi:glycosyltransferase involved in cell wall biosynthesis
MPTRNRPRVLFVAAHDSLGGAARAVHRIYESIRNIFSSDVDIRLRVIHKTHTDPRILGGKASRSRREFLEYFLRTRFRKYFPREPFFSDNTVLHSQALFHTGLGREINKLAPDVIMLGWLGSGTLSIPEIGRLKAPVVWRLSDMWMFSGAEHYTPHARYAESYSRQSRPSSESGPDIDRETFFRKKRHWRYPRHVICPSHWMADQVRQSQLTSNWPVHVIPNPIDAGKWRPVPRLEARAQLGLPSRDLVVLFGAGGGTRDQHKGADLFFETLSHLQKLLRKRADSRRLLGVVFGEDGVERLEAGVPIRFLGRLDDEQLRLAYSAANVMVVPSRLDNLPSTATEAQACGTPVAAFRVGGLPDIVDDSETGKLVEPFNTEELSKAVAWMTETSAREKELGRAARKRAETMWSPKVVAEKYLNVLLAATAGTAQRSR